MIHSINDEMVTGEAPAPKFDVGRLVATPGALKSVPPAEIQVALSRHIHGDWGELDEYDRRKNDLSLQSGSHLLSAYRTKDGVEFWIITGHDRSVTIILVPAEY
jgi:hypothetical protein